MKTHTEETMVSWDARLGGVSLGTVQVYEDTLWDADESDHQRYHVETDESMDGADDMEEARGMVADRIRDVRNTRLEEQREEQEQELRDLLETMIDLGMVKKALAALRNAAK